MLNLQEKILKDYKEMVWECFYYTEKSGFKDVEINQIIEEYNIKILNDYEKFIEQFISLKLVDLWNILSILNIEADNEWTNANRCEAGALILWDYLKLNKEQI